MASQNGSIRTGASGVLPQPEKPDTSGKRCQRPITTGCLFFLRGPMRGGPYETASSLSSEKRDTPRDSATVQFQIALRLLDQRAHDALVQQPSVDRWTKTTERVPETGEVTWPRSRRRPRRGRTRRLSWSASNCSGDNSETVGERRAAPWLLGGVLRRRYAGAHVYPLAWHRVLMLYFRVDIIRCLSPWRRSWPVWASVPWWADDRRPHRKYDGRVPHGWLASPCKGNPPPGTV